MTIPLGMGLSKSAQCVFFCLFAVASHISWALDPEIEALQEADRILQIPGQPLVGFKHYSGYVTIDESHGKALFYWFFEAAHNPTEKPLILWLNGGPGCSSVGIGQAQEIGPFLVRKNHEIIFNNYSWNNVANLLFLDTPAGVGFSYSNATDESYGDDLTALGSYTFLINWLKRFPQYKSKDFYIAGESYAGHYVPQLAEMIFDENQNASKDNYINLKGFIVGNALLDLETDAKGMIDYALSHALISDGLHEAITQNCDLSKAVYSDECWTLINKYNELYAIMDMYSLYSPTCPQARPDVASSVSVKTTKLSRASLLGIPAGYDPCLMNYATSYFNRPDVQYALHANVTRIPGPWSLCNDNMFNEWNDTKFSMLPTIIKLIDGGLRVWIYSGDTDGRIPVTATKYTLNKLGLNVTEDWTVWYNKKQVGGWSIVYDGLTFVTVKGAGHQVPTHAPRRSLQLIKTFLANQNMSSTRY